MKTHEEPPLPRFVGCRGVSRGGSAFRFVRVAVGLGLGDLAGRSFSTASADPSLGPFLGPVLVLLFGRLGNFDNNSAAFELLLVESGNRFFSSLERREGYETITSRATTTMNDLNRDTRDRRNITSIKYIERKGVNDEMFLTHQRQRVGKAL